MLWVLQAAPYKYMLALGTIPFLVYAAVPVKIRVQEKAKVFESNTFVNRWPTSPLVEHVRVRTISIRKQEPAAEKPAQEIIIADDDAIVESEIPPRKKISTRHRVDICARHNRRKVVYYVRGYKHWRCRR